MSFDKNNLKRFVLNKWALLILVLAALYVLAGFFLAPWLISRYLPSLAERHQLQASVDEVNVNPFFLTAELLDVKIQEKDGGPTLSLDRFFFNFELTSLFRWALVFEDVRLEGPTVNVVFSEDGTLNLIRLLSSAKPSNQKPATDSEPLRLVVEHFVLTDGLVRVKDHGLSPPATARLHPFKLELKNLSTLEESTGPYALVTKTVEGGRMSWKGEFEILPFRSSGEFLFENIHIVNLLEFFRDQLNIHPPQGQMHLSGQYDIELGKGKPQLQVGDLEARLSDLTLHRLGAKQPFLKLDRVKLEGGGFDLRKRRIEIGQLLLEQGGIGIVIDLKGRINLQKVLELGSEKKKEPWRISINQVRTRDLSLELLDFSRARPAQLAISDIDLDFAAKMATGNEPLQLKIREFSGQAQKVSLAAMAAEQPAIRIGKVQWREGQVDLAGHSFSINNIDLTNGQIRLARNRTGQINLQQLLKKGPQVPADEEAPDQVEVKGFSASLNHVRTRDLSLELLDYSRARPAQLAIADMDLDFAAKVATGTEPLKLKIRDFSGQAQKVRLAAIRAEQPAIGIGRVQWRQGQIDVASRSLSIGSIDLSNGHIRLARNRTGQTNLLQLLKKGPQVPTAKEKEPWQFRLDQAEAKGFSAAFFDTSLKPQGPLVKLTSLAAEVSNVGGDPLLSFDVRVGLAENQGRLFANGTYDRAGGDLQARLNLEQLGLSVLEPLLKQKMNLVVRSGRLSTQGKLRYDRKGAGTKLFFTGGLAVNRLILTQPGETRPLFGWKSLRTEQFTFSLQPDKLEVANLQLSQPRLRFIVNTDGTLNLIQAFQQGQRKGAKKPRDEVFPVTINRIGIANGLLFFADRSLSPSFNIRVDDLDGTVTKLTRSERPARINLEGRVGRHGKARINGHLSLFSPSQFANLNMQFNDIEMAELSPYVSKFAGRQLEAGRLFLDLDYQIQNGRVEGENDILISSLVLGEKVDSPSAIDLPLDLAIALLEGPEGRIDIELPVRGNLDDPDFSYSQLFWEAFGNLLKKLVTSPINFLTGLFGKEERDLDYLAFDPGDVRLPPPTREKLDQIKPALRDHPRLQLVLMGGYTEEDATALKRQIVHNVLTIGLGESVREGLAEQLHDFQDPRTQRELTRMFIQQFGREELAKLREDLRQEVAPEDLKTRQAREIFDRLVAREKLSNQMLVNLAHARTQKVIEALIAEEGIERERLVVRDPVSLPPEARPSVRMSLEVYPGTGSR